MAPDPTPVTVTTEPSVARPNASNRYNGAVGQRDCLVNDSSALPQHVECATPRAVQGRSQISRLVGSCDVNRLDERRTRVDACGAPNGLKQEQGGYVMHGRGLVFYISIQSVRLVAHATVMFPAVVQGVPWVW